MRSTFKHKVSVPQRTSIKFCSFTLLYNSLLLKREHVIPNQTWVDAKEHLVYEGGRYLMNI